MTIVEFLQARISEDEAQANVLIAMAAPDDWWNPTQTLNFWPEEIAFWDVHTPARVLAECAAKRAIVQLHDMSIDPCDEFDASFKSVPCETLRILAAVYSDHPDYQEEWAA